MIAWVIGELVALILAGTALGAIEGDLPPLEANGWWFAKPPLALYYADLGPPRVQIATTEAMKWWDKETGIKLFDRRAVSPNIVVMVSDNLSPGTLAMTSITLVGEDIVMARVELSSVALSLSDEELQWTMAHELGHCLGLGHSQDRASLMFFAVLDRVPVLTKETKKWVKKTYGP